MRNLSDQELQRRRTLEEIQASGINAYPSATYHVDTRSTQIAEDFAGYEGKQVCLAGRLMTRRIMGSASFGEIQDAYGRMQFYVRRDDICPGEDKAFYNTLFKKQLDIGDHIGFTGKVFKTQTGEISVHIDSLILLSKSLKPLPVAKEVEKEDGNKEVYDAFTDPEQRYRQRYVDLIVNPHVRETFRKRTKLVQAMRDFLNEKEYLEVETPILQPLYGGATARPFKTHHNTLDMTLYLRIANELYLKRLIVGGFDGVYEFSKDFRNEGMSRFHNPEFTQMELYVAYKDYRWMMELVEAMVERVALALHGTTAVQVGENVINFARPWKRLTMYESIQAFTGEDVSGMDEAALRALCHRLSIETDDSFGRAKLIDALFGEKVEPNLIQPTFITDYPVEMSPLAKRRTDKPELVERFEAICNGKEICNAFSELNDPLDQRTRFEEQLELGRRGDVEAMVLDEDFLRAIEYGMPPTAGLGIGIDRLSMIMTNQLSIQEVLFFPQMRAESMETESVGVDYEALGAPAEWQPILNGLSFASAEEFKAANPNRIFNDLGSLRKKHKLDSPVPTVDIIKVWQSQA